MGKSPFKLLNTDGAARAGELITAHGMIQTPVFMPVGTKGAVKSLDPAVVAGLGAPVVLANTYHLFLSPGPKIIEQLGGLHNFMHWPGPILTDSGGFQVFSLSQAENRAGKLLFGPGAKIGDDGVEFTSHRDGSKHFFTPEIVMDVEASLGADIIMAFDECPPYPSSDDYLRQAMERTHRWLDRCLDRKKQLEDKPLVSLAGHSFKQNQPKDQLLFGIVQGGTNRDLRRQSADYLASKDLDGIAIGGVAVGEGHDKMIQQVDWVTVRLPSGRPRYLMGVGTPIDLLEFIGRGVDMFDCVLPTRLGRNGAAWVVDQGKGQRTQIKNARFSLDESPLSEDCQCSTCSRYSRAYLHHLFIEDEPLGMSLLSIHNLYLLLKIAADSREAILNNRFCDYSDRLKRLWKTD